MWALRLAALLALLWGLVAGALALALPGPLEAEAWRALALRGLGGLAVAVALLRGGRIVRAGVAFGAAVFVALGLLLLHGGPAVAAWAWIETPRLAIIVTAAETALAALALALALIPEARGAAARAGAGGVALLLLVAVGVGASATLARYPVLIVDGADLLTPEQERRIARFHRLLRHDHDIDYRLVTGRDLGDIDRYAARRFAADAVGRASRAGHGLLLVLDAARDTVRIEVSRSLEPIYVDAFVAYVEQRQMTEFFADGRVADGVLATTELLVTRAQRGERGLAVNEALRMEGSGGGGARAPARLSAPEDEGSRRASAPAPAHDDDPEAVLAAYGQAMAQRNDNPALSFYSRATRAMLADRTVTPAQMDSMAESVRDCPVHDVRYAQTRAVVRAPLEARTCPPYFFVREDGRWRLDLEPMGRVIRFGRNNTWHLDFGALGDYRFGFADWRFNDNGYPVAER